METPMFAGGRTGHDRHRGLYDKFDVKRRDGRDDKHPDCKYFVLDLTHDPFAIPAILAYADACEMEFPVLATDLRKVVEQAKA